MNIKFTKMHGLGNDYIYFNCIDNPNMIAHPETVARQLADRHFGIGGDGIVLILPHEEADFRMRMFNSDGSEAEMCGNAIRCVTKYLCDNSYVTGNGVDIYTGAEFSALRLSAMKLVVLLRHASIWENLSLTDYIFQSILIVELWLMSPLRWLTVLSMASPVSLWAIHMPLFSLMKLLMNRY